MQNLADILQIVPQPLSLSTIAVNITLATIASLILQRVYIKYGQSISNRRLLAHTFPLIAVTTTPIITIVKSSLALSLGLVGALSIVRFRAAIKEPEELVYLLLTIAVGLGFGADQQLATIVAFIYILIIYLHSKRTSSLHTQLLCTISYPSTDSQKSDKIISKITSYCQTIDLKLLPKTMKKFS